ncbi:MAG: hypothetical protein JW936_00205 [Sedimentisphaerales bacterium]|nr:hypothetical protein [Sedimentisphaerales bacterium]
MRRLEIYGDFYKWGDYRMERQYIFFRTGVGFCVGLIALVVAIFLSGVVLSLVPEIGIVAFGAVFAVCVSVGWIPFWVDGWIVKKSRGR